MIGVPTGLGDIQCSVIAAQGAFDVVGSVRTPGTRR
jgi:hypothetical protein